MQTQHRDAVIQPRFWIRIMTRMVFIVSTEVHKETVVEVRSQTTTSCKQTNNERKRPVSQPPPMVDPGVNESDDDGVLTICGYRCWGPSIIGNYDYSRALVHCMTDHESQALNMRGRALAPCPRPGAASTYRRDLMRLKTNIAHSLSI